MYKLLDDPRLKNVLDRYDIVARYAESDDPMQYDDTIDLFPAGTKDEEAPGYVQIGSGDFIAGVYTSPARDEVVHGKLRRDHVTAVEDAATYMRRHGWI